MQAGVALPDAFLCPRSQGVVLRPLNQLEVSHGSQLQAQVLQRLCSAVDDADIQHNVVLVHCHIRFSIYRVRETCRDTQGGFASSLAYMHDIIAVPCACEQSFGTRLALASQAGLVVLLTAVRAVAANAAQNSGLSEHKPGTDVLAY